MPEQKFKPSIYNYQCDAIGGKILLFNFYTLCLMAVNKPRFKHIQAVLDDPNGNLERHGSELRQLLVKNGYLIDERINEVRLQQVQNRVARKNPSTLSLTILPSLNCNFRCIYCYETHPTLVMSVEVQEALIELVRSRLQEEGRLTVTWFGGEPLLYVKIIEKLSNQLIGICREKRAKYSAGIITNGFYLDAEMARRLARLQISHTQVTLDGPPEIHDLRRPTVHGKPTFARILHNIQESCEILRIDVRMNVDQTNEDMIDDLMAILSDKNLRRKVGLYPGQTSSYTSTCNDIRGTCLNNQEFSLLGLEMNLKLLEQGFISQFNLPASRHYVCLADTDQALVIKPDGGIANCWNETDDTALEIGHLLHPDCEKFQINRSRWEERNPFLLECSKCQLLPICMGGCPYSYLRSGVVSCHPWKYHMDESLVYYYFLQKLKKESESIKALKEKLA